MKSLLIILLIQFIFASGVAFAKPRKRNSLKGIKNLNPFEDVAVLQKKFLPKTERWEFYTAASVLMNDPYFLNLGLQLRLLYSWKEQHAFELVAIDISPSKRKIVEDLVENNKVKTSSLISPEAYFGANYRWSPIYGKMSPFGEGIVPFDMYFSFGGGITATNKGGSEPTLHLGTGQIFAIDKSTAFRWDFSFLALSATAVAEGFKPGDPSTVSTQTFQNLYLNVGMSFLFPEAGYR